MILDVMYLALIKVMFKVVELSKVVVVEYFS
jgi:hypothetical protein